jgi:hypothetical protein
MLYYPVHIFMLILLGYLDVTASRNQLTISDLQKDNDLVCKKGNNLPIKKVRQDTHTQRERERERERETSAFS